MLINIELPASDQRYIQYKYNFFFSILKSITIRLKDSWCLLFEIFKRMHKNIKG